MGGNNTSAHTALCTEIQLELARDPLTKAFVNRAGVLPIRDRYIKYGLADGVSDIIGFRSEVVDSSWIGRHVAVFFGVEVKTGRRSRLSADQVGFLTILAQLGGYSGVARSVDDALRILRVIR